MLLTVLVEYFHRTLQRKKFTSFTFENQNSLVQKGTQINTDFLASFMEHFFAYQKEKSLFTLIIILNSSPTRNQTNDKKEDFNTTYNCIIWRTFFHTV